MLKFGPEENNNIENRHQHWRSIKSAKNKTQKFGWEKCTFGDSIFYATQWSEKNVCVDDDKHLPSLSRNQWSRWIWKCRWFPVILLYSLSPFTRYSVWTNSLSFHSECNGRFIHRGLKLKYISEYHVSNNDSSSNLKNTEFGWK